MVKLKTKKITKKKQIRSFNSINFNEISGVVTKKSNNKDKIEKEVFWYLNLPEDLKVFSLKLIDYKISKKDTSYSLEYYRCPSLAELYVSGSLSFKKWQIIIKRLFEIIDLFKKHKADLSFKAYDYMYYKKTLERLNDLKRISYWRDLIGQDFIQLNNKRYKNIKFFISKLEDIIKDFYNKKEMCFIHGDLCLSNILFDSDNNTFKFVDPRGSFGSYSNFGDLKYDIAKLRHSFCGLYDFITHDQFVLKEKIGSFSLKINIKKKNKIADCFDEELKKQGFDLKKIKIIESLLFLSMIPLHSDGFRRQKAMYLTGIRLINEIIE